MMTAETMMSKRRVNELLGFNLFTRRFQLYFLNLAIIFFQKIVILQLQVSSSMIIYHLRDTLRNINYLSFLKPLK